MPEVQGPNLGVSLRLTHAVITRGIDVGLNRTEDYARNGVPDAAVWAGFAMYMRTFAMVVEGHHLTEDQVAFPYFREKIPGAPFDRLSEEHLKITALLDQVRESSERTAADPEVGASLQRLNSALGQLEMLWHPHIGVEQGYLSPARCRALLGTGEEHARVLQTISQASQQHSGPPSLAAPFMLYNLGPDDRAFFVQVLPPGFLEQFVLGAWKEQWTPMRPFLLD